MPWMAMSYKESSLKEKLSEKCKMEYIPHLVVLDGKTGEVKNYNGKDGMINLKEDRLEDFPFYKPEKEANISNGH